MQLPGVSGLEGSVTAVDKGALWASWSKQRDHLPASEGDVHLVDVLPLHGDAEVKTSSTADKPEPTALAENVTSTAAPATDQVASVGAAERATHVLLGVQALPLRGDEVKLGSEFVLRRENSHWTLHGDNALINGLPANQHQPLALGDTLSLGTTGHGRLIEVVD